MFDLRHRPYIRILVIEEEGLVRAALVALVTSWEGFHVVGEAALETKAFDVAGNQGSSTVVSVTVDNTSASGLDISDWELVQARRRASPTHVFCCEPSLVVDRLRSKSLPNWRNP